MNRRAFLKTIVAGAVAAVVPLPAPVEQFTVTGYITAYFNPGAPHGGTIHFCEHPSELKKIWLDNKLVWSLNQQEK